MMEIGITGGIGSGKSIVSKMLLDMGFSVFNSDDFAKKLLNEKFIQRKIEKSFGKEFLIDEMVDRRKLGDLVFKNKQELDKLNKIIHPEVAKGYENWKGKINQPIIFKEAAILLESGSFKNLDKVILVKSSLELRIRRVMGRDNVSKEEVENRIKNQWSDEEKEKWADYVILNDEYHSLITQINSILKSLD